MTLFGRAVRKLTILYSVLFFVLFISLSFGLYGYLKHSFQGEYSTKVHERVRHEFGGASGARFSTEIFITRNNVLLNKSIEVTLENFRKGLILINAILFLFIPSVSWFLARRTLMPISEVFQRQRQFVSDASHELRTPLAIVANEIEVTLQQPRDQGYYTRTLTVLKEEVARLSNLVKGLLMLAQLERPAEMASHDVEIVDVINKCVASFAKTFVEKKIDSHVQLPEENVQVRGNAPLLELMFSNLIDNAVKFSPEGGGLQIDIANKRHHVEISVRDEGIGISHDDQKKIFDRFYRVDSSRSQAKGYGLGLAIVHKIVSLHKGSIEVSSEPGKGSTFTVTLPVTSA